MKQIEHLEVSVSMQWTVLAASTQHGQITSEPFANFTRLHLSNQANGETPATFDWNLMNKMNETLFSQKDEWDFVYPTTLNS